MSDMMKLCIRIAELLQPVCALI